MFSLIKKKKKKNIFFFFNDTATTEIYTLSLPTLFRSRTVGSDRRLGAPGRQRATLLFRQAVFALGNVEAGADDDDGPGHGVVIHLFAENPPCQPGHEQQLQVAERGQQRGVRQPQRARPAVVPAGAEGAR